MDKLDQLSTLTLITMLEKLESSVERVKHALVDRLEDLRDETRCLENELEDRGYEI